MKTFIQTILKPDDGMCLTDGNTVARTAVVLPEGADPSVWREVTEEELPKEEELL